MPAQGTAEDGKQTRTGCDQRTHDERAVLHELVALNDDQAVVGGKVRGNRVDERVASDGACAWSVTLLFPDRDQRRRSERGARFLTSL